MQIKYRKGTTEVKTIQGGAAKRTDGAEQRRKGQTATRHSLMVVAIKAQICSTKSQEDPNATALEH